MRVFFTASYRGKQYFLLYYNKIYKTIGSLGYKMLETPIIDPAYKSFFEKVARGERKACVENYENHIRQIKEADLVVFECSVPSLSVGFLVEKALGMNKPTIVLYLEDNLPYFLMGNEEDKLIVKAYNEKNLAQVVKDSLQEARQRADTRFNFFISPDLLDYLHKTAKSQETSKSTFIRNLILEHRRKNPNK
jgi:hypothetical protein